MASCAKLVVYKSTLILEWIADRLHRETRLKFYELLNGDLQIVIWDARASMRGIHLQVFRFFSTSPHTPVFLQSLLEFIVFV